MCPHLVVRGQFSREAIRTKIFIIMLSGIFWVAADPAGAGLVYATTNTDLRVIDTSTNAVVTTISMSSHGKLAASPDSTVVYVGEGGPGTIVTVVDTASNSVLTTIPAGGRPKDIAFTPDGTHAYAGNEITRDVTVIDVSTHTALTTIALPPTCAPENVAATPDGTKVYVGISQCNPFAIDTATNTFSSVIGGSSFAKGGSAITPDGHRYFLGYNMEVRVFDTSTDSLVAQFPSFTPDPDPSNCHCESEMAITPDGTRLYLAMVGPSRVSVVDIVPGSPTIYTELATIPLNASSIGATDIAITSDGTRGYVGQRGGKMAVIDTDPGSASYNTLITEINVENSGDVWGVTIAEASVATCVDNDGDGYGTPGSASCTAGPAEDCDDLDASAFPGASELCDGIDNDCDGAVPANEADGDEDTYMVCENDCDDGDSDLNPGAFELPGNIIDENCDGSLGSCDPFADWRNHGQFVRCVAHEVNGLRDAGLIFDDDGDDLVSSAAQSDVGK